MNGADFDDFGCHCASVVENGMRIGKHQADVLLQLVDRRAAREISFLDFVNRFFVPFVKKEAKCLNRNGVDDSFYQSHAIRKLEHNIWNVFRMVRITQDGSKSR